MATSVSIFLTYWTMRCMTRNNNNKSLLDEQLKFTVQSIRLTSNVCCFVWTILGDELWKIISKLKLNWIIFHLPFFVVFSQWYFCKQFSKSNGSLYRCIFQHFLQCMEIGSFYFLPFFLSGCHLFLHISSLWTSTEVNISSLPEHMMINIIRWYFITCVYCIPR